MGLSNDKSHFNWFAILLSFHERRTWYPKNIFMCIFYRNNSTLAHQSLSLGVRTRTRKKNRQMAIDSLIMEKFMLHAASHHPARLYTDIESNSEENKKGKKKYRR